jgi:hypothetical protein
MASLAGTRIAQIKVNHHPRRFGRSKYGLSRIYKVLIDLLTIKTIVSFLSKPLAVFALMAGLAAVIGLSTFTVAMVEWVVHPDDMSIVFFGLGLLYGSLAIVLLLWGIVAELIYRTGNLKLESFAKLRIDTADTSPNSDS